MSSVLRHNRKGSDRDITRLNSLGFALSKIGKLLNCHPTSITIRLKNLNIAPANTRRAFMTEIWDNLPTEYQERIADLIETGDLSNIQGYIRNLIDADMKARTKLVIAA